MKKIESEIRKAYFLDKYVIITPGRALRPRDIKEQTIIKREKECFFCPENINKKNIIDFIAEKNKNDWQVLSIKNIYPAVTINNKKAYGVQEVIIETPFHNKEMAVLSENQIKRILNMYSKRTKMIAQDKKINYVLCFKNQGSKAGASIAHSHSQVFATEIIPFDLREEERLAKKYQEEKGVCPYCDIIKKELKTERKIFEDKDVFAFTPFASEYHYEVWIFPKRHLDNITLLNSSEVNSFAKVLKKILIKLNNLNLSYNYFLHNVICNEDQHFYIKIQPRDSVWAGVELGSGMVINSVPPEEAAKFYKSK